MRVIQVVNEKPEYYALTGTDRYDCDPENPVSFARAVVDRYIDTVRRSNVFDELNTDYLWECVIELIGWHWNFCGDESAARAPWIITAEIQELRDIVDLATRLFYIKKKEAHFP